MKMYNFSETVSYKIEMEVDVRTLLIERKECLDIFCLTLIIKACRHLLSSL